MESVLNKERRSGSRQFHRKSRNSCAPCRRRRVRCNLQPPICANCHRRNESCSYAAQNVQEPGSPRASTSQSKNALLKPGSGNHPGDLGGFWNTGPDSGLPTLHYTSLCGLKPSITSSMAYIMEESFLLTLLPVTERGIFAQEFGRLASAFEYVHRTFTALYELHEWSRSKSVSSLYTSAYQHHIEASMLFRHSRPTVNEINWMAVLMFGIGVIIFQFATFLRTPDVVDNYLELLYVLRGSFQLAVELGPYLRMSSLMQLIRTPPRSSKAYPNEPMLDILACLDSLGCPSDTTAETKHACEQAIAALKEWIIDVNGYPGNWRQFMDWPATVPEQYLSALSQKHPTSLVIFVYWCAIMNSCPKRWYMANWANRAALAAMRHLGPEWDHVLEVPRTLLAFVPGGSAIDIQL
ncbi:hypothetical protein F5Y11DRAFT_355571 [Daldinia sp. FL1419]|nr:hypothetical protein F5Y11DRAFT_355571 [Daldinia sp. FL1419]